MAMAAVLSCHVQNFAEIIHFFITTCTYCEKILAGQSMHIWLLGNTALVQYVLYKVALKPKHSAHIIYNSIVYELFCK